MSRLVSNPYAVQALFEQLGPNISSLLRHPITSFPVEFPVNVCSLAISASLLNIHLYDPEVVIIWNNNFQQHHLAIWAPYISSSRYKIALICRSIKNAESIRKTLPLTPLWIQENDVFAFQQLPVASSLKVFLYPDNERLNEHTVHNYPRHMHVHIGHGDSDKATSANRFSGLYDHIFLADQQAFHRFHLAGVEIPEHRFLAIGAPTLPGLLFRSEIKENTKVLYAPTWEGTNASKNFCSLKEVQTEILAFAKDNPNRLEIRLHPSIGTRDHQFRDNLHDLKPWVDDGITKVDQFNNCDLLLCDVSGILSEFLFTGRPVAIPVAKDNHWLLSHLKQSGLINFVYFWHFDQMTLTDFLLSIAHDPLNEARMLRRRELYAGATNFKDAVNIFDRALDTVVLNHYWRSRRTGHDSLQSAPVTTPILGDYAELVQQIRTGSVTLTS